MKMTSPVLNQGNTFVGSVVYMYIGLHDIDRRTASSFWRSHTHEPRGGCRQRGAVAAATV